MQSTWTSPGTQQRRTGKATPTVSFVHLHWQKCNASTEAVDAIWLTSIASFSWYKKKYKTKQVQRSRATKSLSRSVSCLARPTWRLCDALAQAVGRPPVRRDRDRRRFIVAMHRSHKGVRFAFCTLTCWIMIACCFICVACTLGRSMLYYSGCRPLVLRRNTAGPDIHRSTVGVSVHKYGTTIAVDMYDVHHQAHLYLASRQIRDSEPMCIFILRHACSMYRLHRSTLCLFSQSIGLPKICKCSVIQHSLLSPPIRAFMRSAQLYYNSAQLLYYYISN